MVGKIKNSKRRGSNASAAVKALKAQLAVSFSNTKYKEQAKPSDLDEIVAELKKQGFADKSDDIITKALSNNFAKKYSLTETASSNFLSTVHGKKVYEEAIKKLKASDDAPKDGAKEDAPPKDGADNNAGKADTGKEQDASASDKAPTKRSSKAKKQDAAAAPMKVYVRKGNKRRLLGTISYDKDKKPVITSDIVIKESDRPVPGTTPLPELFGEDNKPLKDLLPYLDRGLKIRVFDITDEHSRIEAALHTNHYLQLDHCHDKKTNEEYYAMFIPMNFKLTTTEAQAEAAKNKEVIGPTRVPKELETLASEIAKAHHDDATLQTSKEVEAEEEARAAEERRKEIARAKELAPQGYQPQGIEHILDAQLMGTHRRTQVDDRPPQVIDDSRMVIKRVTQNCVAAKNADQMTVQLNLQIAKSKEEDLGKLIESFVAYGATKDKRRVEAIPRNDLRELLTKSLELASMVNASDRVKELAQFFGDKYGHVHAMRDFAVWVAEFILNSKAYTAIANNARIVVDKEMAHDFDLDCRSYLVCESPLVYNETWPAFCKMCFKVCGGCTDVILVLSPTLNPSVTLHQIKTTFCESYAAHGFTAEYVFNLNGKMSDRSVASTAMTAAGKDSSKEKGSVHYAVEIAKKELAAHPFPHDNSSEVTEDGGVTTASTSGAAVKPARAAPAPATQGTGAATQKADGANGVSEAKLQSLIHRTVRTAFLEQRRQPQAYESEYDDNEDEWEEIGPEWEHNPPSAPRNGGGGRRIRRGGKRFVGPKRAGKNNSVGGFRGARNFQQQQQQQQKKQTPQAQKKGNSVGNTNNKPQANQQQDNSKKFSGQRRQRGQDASDGN